MVSIPREENFNGSDCSGVSGATNRTFTMTYSNPSSTGIRINADRTMLLQTTDWTYSSGIITFLVPITDTADLYIFYYTTDTTESLDTDLGSANGVRRILGKSNDDLTDTEINPELNVADRKLRSKYCVWYMVDKLWATSIAQTGNMKRKYTTYFGMKDADTAVKLYRNGVLLTQTTDYTIDAAASEITIDDTVTLADGDILEIYYIPDFFDDYANDLACKHIMDTSLVDIPNSAQGTSIYLNIKERITEYDEMVLKKPLVAFYRDHRETHAIW
jgi:hypothetical protein